MHKGVFVGINAKTQPKRILILGESHHINKDDKSNCVAGKEATYPTCRVVTEYLEDTEKKHKNLRFFERIAKSFGENSSLIQEAEAFWNQVYFGNYIPVLCGVGDDTADKMIAENGNRIAYNNALFDFVNSNEIDVIFCFGRRVFNALPCLHSKAEDRGKVVTEIYVGGKSDYISHCVYAPNVDHENTDVILKKELNVYCMRHPSGKGGYNPSNYRKFLKDCFLEYLH